MVEDQGKQEEEKFDFTREGEALGYISLDQARVLAMRTASEAPGAYGPAYQDVPMAFEVVEAEETEDHYVISITFRPQGTFSGIPGREQFFIEKERVIALRQVLIVPALRRRFPVLPTAVGLAVVAVIAVGVVFAVGGFDGGSAGAAAPPSLVGVPAPTMPPIVAATATSTPAPTVTTAPAPAGAVLPTATPLPTPTPIIEVVVKEVLVTATPAPTPVPTPTTKPVALLPRVEPHGSLNVAFQQIGTYQGHPARTDFSQRQYVTLAAYESLFGRDVNGDYYRKLWRSGLSQPITDCGRSGLGKGSHSTVAGEK